jgi:hypothetical protein
MKLLAEPTQQDLAIPMMHTITVEPPSPIPLPHRPSMTGIPCIRQAENEQQAEITEEQLVQAPLHPTLLLQTQTQVGT